MRILLCLIFLLPLNALANRFQAELQQLEHSMQQIKHQVPPGVLAKFPAPAAPKVKASKDEIWSDEISVSQAAMARKPRPTSELQRAADQMLDELSQLDEPEMGPIPVEKRKAGVPPGLRYRSR